MQNITHKQVRTQLNNYLRNYTHATKATVKVHCLSVKHYCKAFDVDVADITAINNVKYIVFVVLYINKQYLQEMEMQEYTHKLGDCCGGSAGALYITQDNKLHVLGDFDNYVRGRYMQVNTMQEGLQEVINSIEMN